VDVDAFFASVEQLRNPRLRGKPVAVGSGVIASCSYEARAFGCHAGQPLSSARRACPGLVVLDGSAAVYAAFGDRVFAVCRRFSPQLETHLDEAVLELTGTERLWGDARAVAERIRREVRRETGLAVTVGLGRNRLVARVATRLAKPDGVGLMEPGTEAARIGALAVAELPGVGPNTSAVLAELGIRSVRDLRRLSREELATLFGTRGGALYERCRGRDSRAVTPREVPRSISRETSFHSPVTDAAKIRAMLHYLVERAGRTTRDLGLRARTVAVHVRASGGRRVSASHSLAQPEATDRAFFAAADRLFARTRPHRVALRAVGVSLSRLVPEGPTQLDLLDHGAVEIAEDLACGVDAVRRRFGQGALVVGPSVSLLSAFPCDADGFVLRTPSLTQ
jgi:DNA polymerase-4